MIIRCRRSTQEADLELPQFGSDGINLPRNDFKLVSEEARSASAGLIQPRLAPEIPSRRPRTRWLLLVLIALSNLGSTASAAYAANTRGLVVGNLVLCGPRLQGTIRKGSRLLEITPLSVSRDATGERFDCLLVTSEGASVPAVHPSWLGWTLFESP